MLSGLVLSRTGHWPFDRGILTVGDVSNHRTDLRTGSGPLLRPDRTIRLPEREQEWSAKVCLRYHRQMFVATCGNRSQGTDG